MPDNNVDPRLLISSFLICRHPCATPTTREKEMDRVCTLVCEDKNVKYVNSRTAFTNSLHMFAERKRGGRGGREGKEREDRTEKEEREEKREGRRKRDNL